MILNELFIYFFAAVRAAGYRKPPRCGFIRWRAGGERRAGFPRQAELLLCLHVACVVRVDWLQGPAAIAEHVAAGRRRRVCRCAATLQGPWA